MLFPIILKLDLENLNYTQYFQKDNLKVTQNNSVIILQTNPTTQFDFPGRVIVRSLT